MTTDCASSSAGTRRACRRSRRLVRLPRDRLARLRRNAAGRPPPRASGKQAAIALFEATPDLWFAGVFSDHSRPDAESIGFVPLLRLTLWTLDRP